MMNALRNKKGFTLVEILVVLAILAILIAVAVPSLNGALNDAKEKTALANARAAYIAYELKASTASEVTTADIAEYMSTSAPESMEIAVKLDTNGHVVNFYYTEETIFKRGKYINIEMGEKAVVVTGTVPADNAGEKITNLGKYPKG